MTVGAKKPPNRMVRRPSLCTPAASSIKVTGDGQLDATSGYDYFGDIDMAMKRLNEKRITSSSALDRIEPVGVALKKTPQATPRTGIE